MRPLWHTLSCFCLFIVTPFVLYPCHGQTSGNIRKNHAEDRQTPAEKPIRNRLLLTTTGQLIAYTGTLVALNQAWYKDYPRSSFHFYNDMKDWKQMDKLGHVVSSYHLNRLNSKAFEWSGLDKNRSALYGAVSTMSFMTAIEVFDGLSKEWGFSIGDAVANMIGSATFVGQELFFGKQVVSWKYSFQRSGLETYRPDLLGTSLMENLIKDYNGITYWLSFGLPPAFNSGNLFPEWLNLAIGYGAYGMLGSTNNPWSHDGMDLPVFERYRRWYLAPDIDFSRIPTNRKWLNSVFFALNALKMPAPAIEYNTLNGWNFHIVFF